MVAQTFDLWLNKEKASRLNFTPHLFTPHIKSHFAEEKKCSKTFVFICLLPSFLAYSDVQDRGQGHVKSEVNPLYLSGLVCTAS